MLDPTGDAGQHGVLGSKTGETVRAPTVPPNLQRIAAQAARDPDRVCTTLASLLDADLLREAYRRPSQASAAGLDGVTAQRYAERREANLRALHACLRSGV